MSDDIQLEDFVAAALLQIAGAVSKATPGLTKLGAVIAPKPMGGPAVVASAGYLRSPRHRPITLVAFDVAVTATASDKEKAGVGVVAGVLGLGAKVEASGSDSRVSRISFSIPIELPSSETEGPSSALEE